MSDGTNKSTIFKCLVSAQKAFGPALKNSTNPHLKNKYADLSACIEAVIGALNDNGLALIQRVHDSAPGQIAVETVFVHESGDEFSGGIVRLPVAQNNAQGFGSALTYARRYSLMSACGIAPEDDDGNAATKQGQKKGPAQSDDDPPWLSAPKPDALRAIKDAIEGEDWLLVGNHIIATKCSMQGKTVREAVERFRPTIVHNVKKFKGADQLAVEAYLSAFPKAAPVAVEKYADDDDIEIELEEGTPNV